MPAADLQFKTPAESQKRFELADGYHTYPITQPSDEAKFSANKLTFPTDGPLFVGLVVGVILIVGGLTFFPALALGPVVEQIAMNTGSLF